MSADASWQEIRNTLSQLLSENSYAPLHSLLEKLQQWSNASPCPVSPEDMMALIELVRRMQNELTQGRSMQEVLGEALTRQYVQPNWDVENVFQAGGHIIQVFLKDFQKEIENETSKPRVPVPIVLLVMNATEAEELRQGVALIKDADEVRTDFDNLQTLLNENGAADWIGRYGETSQEWKPFANATGAETIEQHINKTLNRITGYESTFVPIFIDVHTLNEESNRPLLKELRQEGCIVIMDGISMRHPTIHREFYQSNLDAYANTSVVNIAPIHSAFDMLRDMTLIIQMRISDMEFAKRRMYDDDEDYGICEELCDETQFKHWFVNRVKKISGPKAVPQTSIRSHMFNRLENIR